MASDRDFDELHAFAARLGLRRGWFQRDHYDLPPTAAPPRSRSVQPRSGRGSSSSAWRARAATARGAAGARRAACCGCAAATARPLRYPAGALVIWAGRPAPASRSSRAGGACRVPVLIPRPRAAEARAERRGAVAVSAAAHPDRRAGGRRGGAGAPAHLLLATRAEALCRARSRAPDAVFDRLLGELAGLPRRARRGARPGPVRLDHRRRARPRSRRLARISLTAPEQEP